MDKTLLNINHITKKFNNKIVLDNLSFHVNEGEILGILGPNGAGKSTSFNIITGLLKPDSGKVYFTDKENNTNIKKYKSSIGVVPQDISLYEGMTINENLRFLGKLYGVRGKYLSEKVDRLVDEMKLTDKNNSEVGNLSGGMKRRVNIAAALVHSPKLVIMDEPTVGIDPQSRNVVWDIIKNLKNKNISVIVTSHYVDEIERLSDRVLIIDSGKVIAEGTVESLIEKYCESKTYNIEFYENNNLMAKEIKEIVDVQSINIYESSIKIKTSKDVNIIENIVKIASRNNTDIKNIDVKRPGLEDVFFNLTGKGLRE